MVFSSILFMFIYLPVVLAVYYISPVKWRNPVLFVANLVFYGWGEPVYILLMMLSITVNYVNGLLIGKYKAAGDMKRAKAVLIVNVVINLSLLGFFKYYDLIVTTLSALPFIDIAPLGLTLPIGISFYTFQTMSYPIDVYRGDADVQRNYISFGTFVALFPQLIAGPIVRYKDVADQLGFRASSIDQFSSGVERFIGGLAKKVLIANNIGALWDVYAADPGNLTTLGAWLGILAFSLQIYFDFSGYSDMAVGLGRMIGFEFKENFNYPYISRSVTEFWRRWHISLGTWFRDYVYIPLGGNRHGLGRQLFNITVVWALTGIWHGANWTFLFWGLYYAVFLILEKSFLLRWLDRAPRALGHVYTLFVVVCGWVLFQLEDMTAVSQYFSAMFGGGAGLVVARDLFYLVSYAAIFVIGAVSATPLGAKAYRSLPPKVKAVAGPALIVAVLVLATAYLVDSTYNPFLYWNF